jgi:hypothetical protein
MSSWFPTPLDVASRSAQRIVDRRAISHPQPKAPSEEDPPMENPVRDFSPLLIGLIAFNALLSVTLYSRKSRRDLIERRLGWMLRGEIALAEKQALREAR